LYSPNGVESWTFAGALRRWTPFGSATAAREAIVSGWSSRSGALRSPTPAQRRTSREGASELGRKSCSPSRRARSTCRV
jgi:hypothetical protein